MAYAVDDQPVQLAVGHAAIATALAMLPTEAEWVAHYGTGFDFPVLKRLFGLVPGKVFDTKVAGSLFDPEFSGTHSLEDWGVRVHAPKDNYKAECLALGIDPWVEYTPRTGDYCKQDVETLRAVHKYMKAKWLDGSHDWSTSIAMEQHVSAIMAEQAHNGCWFNMPAAVELRDRMTAKIAELTALCTSIIKPRCDQGEPVAKCFKKDGNVSANAWKALGYATEEAYTASGVRIVGDFTRVGFSDYDLNSRQQVVHLLQQQGWVPTEFTEKGSAKFSADTVLPEHIGAIGQALAERFVTTTRLGQLEGWIGKVRDDGRIEAKAQSNATPTGRMRHSVVVNVPKPGTAWGVEMRGLFGVPEGKLQVGVDAAGLELRMLAHYMGDPEFTAQVISGDVHWYVAQKCGFIAQGSKRNKDQETEEGKLHHRARECAKRWIYALIYGAGDPKLGETIGEFKLPGWHGTEAEGELSRQRIMTNLPKLGKLMERIDATLWKEETDKHGRTKRVRARQWLMGLDGRKLYIRHDHAALNTLLQSAGSIVVKAATVYAHINIKKQGLGAKQIIHMHDEAQYECMPEVGGRVAWLFQKGIKWAEQKYKVRCPLEGSTAYGFSWSDCH